MGNSSSDASPGQRCAVCERSFGMLLWKHTCDVCRRTVCDDCGPRETESTNAQAETTLLRVCKVCAASGRRVGNATGGDAAVAAGPAGGAGRVDPNSESEREKRARLIEERNKAQQSRGRPAGGTGERPAAPTRLAPPTSSTAAAASPSAPAPSAASPPSQPAQSPPQSDRPINPALEAAMRRQQQQQQQGRGGSAAAAGASANMSPEKMRLLREVEALLAKHNEDPPFGLRASDETKLRGYLQFLKSKYHVNE